jgi:carboxy-terminal domain RNA polymerase II polypeptide A small phosphatase
MKNSEKKLLVFDLDETLIHARHQRLPIKEDFKYDEYYVYKRPYLDDFLLECSQNYSLAIWSSAENDYVKNIAKQLIINDLKFDFVWSLKNCWLKIAQVKDDYWGITRREPQYIKPLEKIRRKGYKLSNLLIVDDSSYKVIDNQPNSYYIIKPFEGDIKDNELLNFWINLPEKLANSC